MWPLLRLGLLYVMIPLLVFGTKYTSGRIDHLISARKVRAGIKIRCRRDGNRWCLPHDKRAAGIWVWYHRRGHRWRHLCRCTGHKQYKEPDRCDHVRHQGPPGISTTSPSGWTCRGRLPSNVGHASGKNHFGRPAPRCAVAVAELRAMSAPRAARLRSRSHSVGTRHFERQAAPLRALHCLRPQGRDDSASELGRH